MSKVTFVFGMVSVYFARVAAACRAGVVLVEVAAAKTATKAEGKVLAVHDEEAATMQRLRELRSSGLTLRAVIDQATVEGLRNRAGKPFTMATVHKLVRDAA